MYFFGAATAAAAVLRFHAVGAVPLTQTLYAEIVSGAKESKIITSIPARAFANYQTETFTLGAMPLLEFIGENAFSLMGIGFEDWTDDDGGSQDRTNPAVIKIDAGDCPKLKYIGRFAFGNPGRGKNQNVAGNPKSKISFGATPNLQRIESFAFGGIGELRLAFGDLPRLTNIQYGAFFYDYGASNAGNVVTLGAMPLLTSIGSKAFYGMRGLTLNAGACPNLRSIGSSAFQYAPLYRIAFGALPGLNSIGEGAFQQGATGSRLILNAGRCPKLHSIGRYAFASNIKGGASSSSSISFAYLDTLQSFGEGTFRRFPGTLTLDCRATPSFPKLTAVHSTAFEGLINTKSVIYLPARGSVPILENAMAGFDFPGSIKYSNVVGCGGSDSHVLLTNGLYVEIKDLPEAEKEKRVGEITCIPAYEFGYFATDIVLGDMPKLQLIDSSAFRGFSKTLTIGKMPALTSIGKDAFNGLTGKITISDGNCKQLLKVEPFAFANIRHTESSVTFDATPALQSIEASAFENFRGVLKIGSAGAANDMKALVEIQAGAFASISNTDSVVSMGALPALKILGLADGVTGVFTGFAGSLTLGKMPVVTYIGQDAFKGATGKITMTAGACPKLTVIGASAFESATNLDSSVTFGATPAIISIRESAFKDMKGHLTFAAGDATDFTTFYASAFAGVTNSKSSITFTNLGLLRVVEASAFAGYAGKMLLSLAPEYNSIASVATSAFDGTSNAASTVILPQEGKTPLLKKALTGRFGGTVIHRADPGSPCNQKTSAGTWAECTDGRASMCKYHCCSLGVSTECLSCGSDGGCYDLLFTPADAKAAKTQRNEWPETIFLNLKAALPTDKIISDKSTVKRASASVTVRYKLKWGGDEKASNADVNKPPPRTGLVDAGKDKDPGSVTVDAKTGVVTASPDKAGTFVMWLIAYEVDKDGIEVHKQANVPNEFDEIVVARWGFEAKPIPKFGTVSSWNTKTNSVTQLIKTEFVVNGLLAGGVREWGGRKFQHAY